MIKNAETLVRIVEVLKETGPLSPREILEKLDDRGVTFRPDLPIIKRRQKFANLLWMNQQAKNEKFVVRDAKTHLYQPATTELLTSRVNEVVTKPPKSNGKTQQPLAHWVKQQSLVRKTNQLVITSYLLRIGNGKEQIMPIQECQEFPLDGKDYLLIRLNPN